ncbi:putative ribonuclease H-like domain-containing protein [Tanacetum coccineum]
MARWAIELGEHDIEYKPRNTIKAQGLTNFLAETQEEDEETDFQSQEEKGKNARWRLYTDGASGDDGLGLSREQHPPPPEEPPVVIEPLRIEYPFQEEPPVEPMADTRTMAQLLQAPTEGYEDAILIPEIVANNFELRHGLINLVQNKQFFGHDKEDPHAHIRYFNKITSTMRVPNVPIATIKLMLFPFSIEGAARIWLEKEPPRSIQTWDDLVSKFINQFFPPSKTTNLRNEITRFQQRFDESFYEAWDRFNDLLRACPHHGFSELHQLDTFYNALNINDQDSLNSAAGGNFLDKMPRECLKIIESKSKVRQTRAKAVVAKVYCPSIALRQENQAFCSSPAPVTCQKQEVDINKKTEKPKPNDKNGRWNGKGLWQKSRPSPIVSASSSTEETTVVTEPLRIEYPFQEDPPVEPMAGTLETMAQLLKHHRWGTRTQFLIPQVEHLLGQIASARCLKSSRASPKVRQTRAKAVVAKDIVRALLLDKKNQASAPAPAPAPVKAVELSCVTCGGAHSHQNCPATHGNVYRDNISEYVSQAAAANYNQVSSNFRPQMVANHIRPPGFPPVQNSQANNANNFNRGNNFNQNRESNFNQNRGGNFNQSNFSQNQLHRPQVNQSPAYQAPVPQTHSVTKNDFDNYVKANDAIMRNMQNNLQNQGQSMQIETNKLNNQMANLTDMLAKFVTANTASTSGSGTLPGNTVTNPREDLKGITTRSGVAYQGPPIPTSSVVKPIPENRDVIEFCRSKGIKRKYSNARTLQQNGVAERKNMTLIEAARTMLADSFLPNTFWAEAVSTACYVLNRVLVTKPQNKTPYELVTGKIPIISYIRPFGCHVTILNTIDHLGKFEGKLDEGFLVGIPMDARKGLTWLFDLDYLTDSMNYQPVRSENQANKHAGPQEANPNAVDKENQVFLDELERLKRQEQDANDAAEALRKEFAQETEDLLLHAGAAKARSTNIVNTASTPVSTASSYDGLSFTDLTNVEQDDSEIHALEEIYANPTDGIFTNSSYDDEGAVADFTNLEPVVNVSPIPSSRINSIHPSTLILGDPQSAVQTRSKVTKSSRAHAFKFFEALEDESWVDAMQEELLQFKIKKVLDLVDLAYGIRQLEQNGQEEGIDYDEMDVKSAFLYGKIDKEVYVSQHLGFINPKYPKKVYKVEKALYGLHQAPKAWYATLSTFLLKNGYRRGTIDRTLFIKKDKHDIILVQVYVDNMIFGSTKKSWWDEFEALMKSRFHMSSMGELTFFLGLQVKQKEDGIFISQDKYVAEILKKFDFVSVKTASTPIETQKPLVKDEEASDVDVHLYRSMIGSLMYLTASRPGIMFAVCACSRFQVTLKSSHLSAIKRIFRYLKGKPKLGLWYPRVSSFDLEAYSDSDYAGANLDRKSTTGGCQFLGRRLISWQYKKQTIVATSTTEAEYVAAANYYGQVLWIQNQMLDYGFNFMNTKIYIDNESTICIVKNPVYHSKTKHIAIRHHFIRDVMRRNLSSSIHNALTVSPVVSTTFVEQFWMSAKSKIINNVRSITAKVAGKPVSISEASIRSDLLFDDADGIDSLPNQAIFDAIHSMGKHFSGKVTPLFASMLVQPTEDEGATSERPSEPQPTPSPPHPSEANVEPQSDPSPRPSPSTHIPDSIPESSGGNHGGQSSSDKSLSGNEGDMTLQSVYDLCISLCTQVTDQAKEIKHLKAQIKKLKKKAKPVITHHRAWMKSVSLKQRLAGKKSLKKQWMQKESVSKQGRKPAKAEPSVHKDPLFDELADDTLDFMDTENAQDMGRSRFVVHEEKEREEKEVSTEDVVSTDKEKVSTDRSKVSTDRSRVSTKKEEVSTDRPDEGTDDQTKGRSATPTTQTPTPTIFGDDETIAQVLLNMSQAKAVSREKEKGPPSSKDDQKINGKRKLKRKNESDTESEAEEEVKKLAEEEAIKAALSNEYDFIQARIEADRLLALRLQDEEREHTIKERAKFLHDTIATQRRFLAEQRAIAIRNKPPTRTQLRNQMMTYLKHVGNKKHSDLKSKTFEEIQALYEKVKRFDESFTVVGSTKDERRIKEMNEGVKDTDQKRLKEEDIEKSDDDSDDEHRKCLKIVTFEGTLDIKIMEKKSVIARLDKLMMEQYSEITLEGFELTLWGDLKIMMESSTEENYQSDFWSNQQDWKIITLRLYKACGVCILELEDRIVIDMLVERRYPLSKELLQRMLDLGLEVERESIVALDLIRFIKKQIDEE